MTLLRAAACRLEVIGVVLLIQAFASRCYRGWILLHLLFDALLLQLLDIVLERQLSYFSDLEGIEGLIRYLGNSPWAQLMAMIAADFNADNPRRPFALWKDIDPDFKDLVVRMMNVDPTRRLTANEALAHKWFSDVP